MCLLNPVPKKSVKLITNIKNKKELAIQIIFLLSHIYSKSFNDQQIMPKI